MLVNIELDQGLLGGDVVSRVSKAVREPLLNRLLWVAPAADPPGVDAWEARGLDVALLGAALLEHGLAVLCCTVPFCTVLCCTVLYCTWNTVSQ